MFFLGTCQSIYHPFKLKTHVWFKSGLEQVRIRSKKPKKEVSLEQQAANELKTLEKKLPGNSLAMHFVMQYVLGKKDPLITLCFFPLWMVQFLMVNQGSRV